MTKQEHTLTHVKTLSDVILYLLSDEYSEIPCSVLSNKDIYTIGCEAGIDPIILQDISLISRTLATLVADRRIIRIKFQRARGLRAYFMYALASTKLRVELDDHTTVTLKTTGC